MTLTGPLALFFAVVVAVNALIIKREWAWKRVAAAVLPWVIGAFILEGAVRFAIPQAGQTIWPGYPPGLVVVDPYLGHAYAPGFRGNYPQPRYAHIPIEINSQGFRDAEWPAPDGPMRVLVFGDSITFGSPLAAAERYTNVAQDMLTADDVPVMVMNAGVNGYNVEQYRRLLELRGEALRPDVVLIGLCLNDAEPLAPVDAETMAAGIGDAGIAWRLRPYRLDPTQSYAWNLGRRLVMGRLYASPKYGPRMIDKYNRKTQDELRTLYTSGDGARRLTGELTRIRDVAAHTLNAKTAVLVFPYHSQLTANDPTLTDAATRVAADLGLLTDNLFVDFRAHIDDAELYAHQDDCHPGAPGHRIAGEAAAKIIREAISEE